MKRLNFIYFLIGLFSCNTGLEENIEGIWISTSNDTMVFSENNWVKLYDGSMVQYKLEEDTLSFYLEGQSNLTELIKISLFDDEKVLILQPLIWERGSIDTLYRFQTAK